MKKLFISILIMLIPAIALASQITLEWDSVDNASGYGLFQRSFQHPYDYGNPVWEGTATTAILTVPDDIETAFVCRAFAYGPIDLSGNTTKSWSADSNEVSYMPDTVTPEAPKNLIQRIVQAILNLFQRYWG